MSEVSPTTEEPPTQPKRPTEWWSFNAALAVLPLWFVNAQEFVRDPQAVSPLLAFVCILPSLVGLWAASNCWSQAKTGKWWLRWFWKYPVTLSLGWASLKNVAAWGVVLISPHVYWLRS